MIPSPPPRNPRMGFLFLPPFRVQGCSIAGEETVIQVPELDVCFDVGRCPRLALTSNFLALTHGHMDHAAGIAYYFSQRNFQGMENGTVLCHEGLAQPLQRLMNAWVEVEGQRTPHKIVGLKPGEDHPIKNNMMLRALKTQHTATSLGYVIIEKRSKLKPEYYGLPQEKLIEIKKTGVDITYHLEIPLVAFTGDTSVCDFFDHDHVKNARILITECTFIERGHQDRARVGNHLHISELAKLLGQMNNETVVLTHLSRRTHVGQARGEINRALPRELADKVHILMDHRAGRERYDQQLAEAQQAMGEEEAVDEGE